MVRYTDLSDMTLTVLTRRENPNQPTMYMYLSFSCVFKCISMAHLVVHMRAHVCMCVLGNFYFSAVKLSMAFFMPGSISVDPLVAVQSVQNSYIFWQQKINDPFALSRVLKIINKKKNLEQLYSSCLSVYKSVFSLVTEKKGRIRLT